MTSETDKLIKSALDFDPLAEAEKDVGPDASFSALVLGIAYAQDKQKMINRLMDKTEDTHKDVSFDRYCEIATSYGFEQVYEEEFTVHPEFAGDSPVDEIQRIFWHPKGFLLSVVSYSRWKGRKVNTATVYYAFDVPRDFISDFSLVSSSGGYSVWDEIEKRYVWSGDTDVREGLKYHLDSMCELAKPLAEWPSTLTVWLLHYGDERVPSDLPWSEKSKLYDAARDRKLDALDAKLAGMIRKAMATKNFIRERAK